MNSRLSVEDDVEWDHQRIKKLAKRALKLLSKMITDEEERTNTLFRKIYANKNPTRDDVENNFRLLRTHAKGAMCIQGVIGCDHVATRLCAHFLQCGCLNSVVVSEYDRTKETLMKKRKEFVKEDEELRVITKESDLYFGIGTFQVRRREDRAPSR